MLLLWATFQSGAFRFGKEEEIYLRFGNVGGLEEGPPVRLNGVPVGIVRKIELVEIERREGPDGRQGRNAHAPATRARARGSPPSDSCRSLRRAGHGRRIAPPIASDAEISTTIVTDPQVLIGRVNDMADTVEVILSNLNATRGFGSGSDAGTPGPRRAPLRQPGRDEPERERAWRRA